MSNWVEFLPLALIILVFYLLVLRPARNRQKDFLATQQQVSAGKRVMLASGIFGDVANVRDEEVDLAIAPGVVVTVARQAVARVIEPEVAPTSEDSTD